MTTKDPSSPDSEPGVVDTRRSIQPPASAPHPSNPHPPSHQPAALTPSPSSRRPSPPSSHRPVSPPSTSLPYSTPTPPPPPTFATAHALNQDSPPSSRPISLPPPSALPGQLPSSSSKGTLPSSVQKALLTLDKLKTKLDTIERQRKEPIAIIGLACRFPGGASTPEAFFRILEDGLDAIVQVPEARWPEPAPPSDPAMQGARWGGFLSEDISQFDPSFFGISPREAERLDPQQRIVLELTWEAMERAGQVPSALIGSRTGVFVGLMTTDYMTLSIEAPEETWDGYVATGSAHCFPAGRIAYTFGFQGPTMVVDTACSSSLVAAHLACQSLRTGESDMAVAGGVNLLLSAVMSKLTARTNALSPDGRCKTFDARANGYVRGEGAGMLLLKRLSDAQRDGDPIFALIRGSAVNQDGRSTGLTTPNVLSQQAMLRQALSNARVQSEDVSYVETHGTGTPLGDPIELEALRAVLGGHREDGTSCVLGAVKTNIGHLEAAAGVASLIKATMALQKGLIPRNLHLRALNPRISLEGTPFVLPAENRPWPPGLKPRIAGVSSFGLSGTNAHLILEEAPAELVEDVASPEVSSYLLALSAKTPEALGELSDAFGRMLSEHDGARLYDIAYTAALRRTHHEHRLTVVGKSRDELSAALAAHRQDGSAPGVIQGKAAPQGNLKVVFVFPGHGSQWIGMGRQLFREEEVFRSSMQLCHESIRRIGRFSLLDEIEADEQRSQLGNVHVVQSTIFAIQVSLAALWRSWGIEPDAVVGHSMGEVAAARVAGILSLEDAVKVICRRSMALERIAGKGAVAQVELSATEAQRAIAGFEGRVSVAVHNGPRSTGISGDPEAVDAVVAMLEEKGIFCRRVKTDIAFHSPQVDPLKEDLASVLNLRPRASQLPLFSTVTGDVVRGPEMTAEYWVKNLREPVLFAEVTRKLLDDRQVIFLELSPHPILISSIEESLQEKHHAGTAIKSLRRNTDERRSMLEGLGALHARGAQINWRSLFPSRGRSVQLPTYPWQRQRYWIEAAAKGGARRAAPVTANGPAPLLGPALSVAERPEVHLWQLPLSLARLPFLAQPQGQGAVVVPPAVYVEAALEAAREVLGEVPVSLRDVQLLQPMTVEPDDEVLIEVSLAPGGPDRWFYRWSSLHRSPVAPRGAPSEWVHHATAEAVASRVTGEPTAPISTARARCSTPISREDLERAASRMEIEAEPVFSSVREAWGGVGELFARVAAQPGEAAPSRGFVIHPTLLGTCIRVVSANLAAKETAPQSVTHIREVRFQRSIEGEALVHGSLRSSDASGTETDLRIAGVDGRPQIELDGLRTVPVSQDTLLLRGLSDAFFTVQWRQAKLAGTPSSPSRGCWLILDDGRGVGEALRRLLVARGLAARLVGARGASSALAGEDIDPADSAAIGALVRRAVASSASLAGVVHLWGLTSEPSSLLEMEAAQQRGCGSALAVAQAMIDAGVGTAPLFLVTLGTQAVGAAPRVVAATHATLWGLGRAISAEHPELQCSRIDLDPHQAPEHTEALLREILGPRGEDEVALRAEGRFVPRLVRGRLPPASPGKEKPVRPDATYLVSGGLGGLGLVAAEQLAAEGAAHLVLVGRSGVRTESQRDAVDRLRASGVEVHVAQSDVANEAQLEELLRDIAARMPPLRGVVHTAGVLEDGLLENQTWDRFRKVFGPKVLGAWNLHRATAGLPLDFFVLYSSMSSVLAPPGVSNYVAANAYLDALSHQRNQDGLAATSIDWGLFAEVGMGVKATGAVQMESLAMDALTPRQGAALLGSALRGGWAQAGLAKVDFGALVKAYPTRAEVPRFREVLPSAAADTAGRAASTRDDALLRAVVAAPNSERPGLLAAPIQAQLGKILRIDASRLSMSDALGNHGFDSLMGMEIRTWLERTLDVKLSMAEIMSNARGEAIVALAAKRLPATAGGPVASAPAPGEEELITAAPEPTEIALPEARAPGSWVVIPKPVPGARVRLICFPYAGGTASIFAGWPAELPPEVEVCAIQPPGRHERMHEALPQSVGEMVRELVPALLPYLDKPFATFGHCLGAIVMYETLRELAAKHGKKPLQVFASAAPPPRRYLLSSVASLSGEEFKGLLRAAGFAQESVLADSDVVEQLLPVVRSDFEVAAGYVHAEGPPLEAPLTVFAGLQDGFAPIGVVEEWREETTARFSKVAFPGGHYFIVPERSLVLGHIGQEVVFQLAAADHEAGNITSDDRWIVRPQPKRAPRLRMLCFPGIGQSSVDYATWGSAFGEDVEVVILEPPGRGARSAQLPLGRAVELGAHAARAVLRLSDRPFAFFGHDLGALAMFECVRRLRRGEAPLPIHLFASSVMSPDLHYLSPIHHLPRAAFLTEIQKLGVVPSLPEPTLRADCGAMASYSYVREAPLDIPITAIAGERDAFVPLSGVRGWLKHTRREGTLVLRPGGHGWTEAERRLLLELGARLVVVADRGEDAVA